jgi:DNA-binding MarR family transcriptional regulator
MQDYHLQLFLKLYLIGKKIQALIKRHNLDILSQWIILWMLSGQTLTVSELADRLGVKLSAMSSRINQMQKDGLLERVKARDNRTNMAAITEKGKIMLKKFNSDMKIRCHGRNLNISKDEAVIVTGLLEKINMEEI